MQDATSLENISFDATVNANKTQITIDPTLDFTSSQKINLILSASLEDSLDQAINEVATTFIVKDIVPPTASIIPANGSQNIPTNLNISITFSEPIRKKDNGIITGSDIAAGLVVLKANDANGSPYSFSANINPNYSIIEIDPLI